MKTFNKQVLKSAPDWLITLYAQAEEYLINKGHKVLAHGEFENCTILMLAPTDEFLFLSIK